MEKKIAIICKTNNNIECEDRIRKECISLSKFAEVKIFLVDKTNANKIGYTSYGIPYKSFKLKSRDILPSAKFLLVKLIDFYWTIKNELKGYDYIWAHDESTFLFPLLERNSRCIWDLHELPLIFVNPFKKIIFRIIEKKSLKVLHANEYRIEYLLKEKIIKNINKHIAIRNYPDKLFISYNDSEQFKKIKEWLGTDKYVYLQGLTSPDRHPFNSIASVLEATNLKVIVAGGIDNDCFQKLINKYNKILNSRVLFLGTIDLLETSVLLKNSFFSIILYSNSTPNNKYCEPNRFYQAINLKIPVITSCNDSMAEIVKRDNIGIVLSSYGDDLNEIIEAIKLLLTNYSFYKQNCMYNSNSYIWKDNFIDPSWFNH
jgi:hypothetical protein